MAENNFLVFDENGNTIMADADYKIATQRLGGVTPGIADPTLHNKLYRQASIMAAALAQVVSDNDFDATDEDKARLAQNIQNAILQIVNTHFVCVKSVTANDGKATVTKSDGTTTEFDTGINILQRGKTYAVGDLACSADLPSWAYLECITAGTTASSEPDFSDVTEGSDSSYDDLGTTVSEYVAELEAKTDVASGVIPGGTIRLEESTTESA